MMIRLRWERSTWITGVCNLHFENGVFIYNNSEIDRIERDFQQTLAKCHKVTLIEVRKRTMLTKIIGQVVAFVRTVDVDRKSFL